MLAFLYKGESDGEVIGLRTHWWGILGLIGWAYLTCALVYLLTNGKLKTQLVVLILFLAYNMLRTAGMLDFLSPLLRYCWFIGSGSEVFLIMSGIVVSLIYKNNIHGCRSVVLSLRKAPHTIAYWSLRNLPVVVMRYAKNPS